MSKFELSLLIPEGAEYKEWETVQRDILSELLSAHLIEGIDEDCGKKLGDILTDDSMAWLAVNMSIHDSYDVFLSIVRKNIGFTSIEATTCFLRNLMLVGNGECPWCGASSYQEIPMSLDYEYDRDDGNTERWLSPPKRICHNCQYEWSVEK